MPPTLPASSPSSREARALLIRPCTLRCTIGWRRSEKLFPSCTMLLRHGAHLPAVGAVLRRRASAPAPVCARLHHRPSWHLCCVVPYVHWPWESGTVRVCGRDQCGPLSRSFRCVLDTSAVCFTARLLPDRSPRAWVLDYCAPGGELGSFACPCVIATSSCCCLCHVHGWLSHQRPALSCIRRTVQVITESYLPSHRPVTRSLSRRASNSCTHSDGPLTLLPCAGLAWPALLTEANANADFSLSVVSVSPSFFVCAE